MLTLFGGHVLRSVQGHVLVDRHSTLPVKADRGDAPGEVSRSGKPGQLGGTGTEASFVWTMRGSPLVLAFARRFTNAGQKRKEVAASVPARTREFRTECPHVAKQFAEVAEVTFGLEYAHAQHPRKGNAAGVNGDLARGERRR
jgi:hypothetical protein